MLFVVGKFRFEHQFKGICRLPYPDEAADFGFTPVFLLIRDLVLDKPVVIIPLERAPQRERVRYRTTDGTLDVPVGFLARIKGGVDKPFECIPGSPGGNG